jgi:hypothetical protein
MATDKKRDMRVRIQKKVVVIIVLYGKYSNLMDVTIRTAIILDGVEPKPPAPARNTPDSFLRKLKN